MRCHSVKERVLAKATYDARALCSPVIEELSIRLVYLMSTLT